MSDWWDTIGALIEYLRYQQENGVRQLPLAEAELKRLAASGGAASPAQATVTAATPAKPELVAETQAQRLAALECIAAKIEECHACPLGAGRTRTVPGQGNADAPDVMFIGEAPGQEEDQQGLAFVGAAGKLLTKMIAAMGYTRDEVFIANICKCRPPGNRKPSADEMRACIPFLQAQIEIVRPKVIVTLGATALTGLLNTQSGISQLRGHWTSFNGIPLMPTFHPAYLLRFPSAKHNAWDDLKQVLKRLGRPLPQR